MRRSGSRGGHGRGGGARVLGLASLGLGVALGATAPARAAMGPAAGSHTAGEGAGGSGATGGFSASIALDLPAARGGTPLPLGVVYGGQRVGAAGLGWDVPLSYVVRNATLAHHRPKPDAFVTTGATVTPPVTYTLVLAGESVELVRNAANTAWVGRRGGMQLELRDAGAGAMVLYDGQGNTYSFSSQGNAAVPRLGGGDLFLLTDVVGLGSNAVHLDYDIGAPGLVAGDMAVNLVGVSYNKSPTTGGCYKHQVQLVYDAPVTGTPGPSGRPTPLGVAMVNGQTLTRLSTLSSVVVKAQSTCGSGFQTLKTYALSYQPDTDTRLPRLRAVTMTGQAGTPEGSVVMPVASYEYGSVVDPATGLITYQRTQSAGPQPIPGAGLYDFGINYSKTGSTADPHPAGTRLHEVTAAQQLVDLNGDGRLDLFAKSVGGTAMNVVSTTGLTSFATPGAPGFLGGEMSHVLTIGTRSGSSSTAPVYFGSDSTTVNDTLRSLVDMNGDGRMDVLEAPLSDPDHWLLHLNTPDPTTTFGVKYVDVHLPVARMRAALNVAGLATRTTFTRVPLGRKTTGFNGTDLMQTISEFELRDVNGDGYPDFVFNATSVSQSVPVEIGQVPSASRAVMVMYNTAGVHLADSVDLFSSPTTLVADTPGGCGLGRWQGTAGSTFLTNVCGFADVNGDGLADRVEAKSDAWGVTSYVAYLGTGMPGTVFAGASSAGLTVTLPGPLGTMVVPVPLGVGDDGGTDLIATYGTTTRTVAGLRDINGDGIPDYVSRSTCANFGTACWLVSMGTGIGYASPVQVNSPGGFELSLESSDATTGGLFDVDGDGQPDFVSMAVTVPVATHWDLYQLKSPAPQPDVTCAPAGCVPFVGVPQAGKLTRISNGYGAATRIGYRSGKQDAKSHNTADGSTPVVARPEIVVTAVSTIAADQAGAGSGAPLLTTTHYAYRGAIQTFDPALDRFVLSGYQQAITLRQSNPEDSPGAAILTVREAYGLTPFSASMDAATRLQRYLQVGRAKDVTTLAGTFGTDPWTIDLSALSSHPARISGAHYDYGARLLTTGPTPTPVSNDRCIDMMYPYDYTASLANQGATWEDECTKRGFLYSTAVTSWRGAPGMADPIASSTTVKSGTRVVAVDDLGRTTAQRVSNDLLRTDDDVCVFTTYATPTGTSARVLSAPATVTLTAEAECHDQPAGPVLRRTRYEYDALATGSVSLGLPTAAVVSRLDENGAPIPGATGSNEIRLFDASYDPQTGQPTTQTAVRDDGATETVTYRYDDFGLAPTVVRTDATNADGSALAPQQVSTTRDGLTLAPTYVTETNGLQVGYTYDGYVRPVATSVAPPVGPAGVMSTTSYLGFAANDSSGRRIVSKVFSDPVPASSAASAVGRTTTAYLDALGRESSSEAQLGSSYAGQTLVAERSYDLLGRVRFAAEPHAAGSGAPSYGTTYFYNDDGTPQCFVRANRNPPRTAVTDEVTQRYPTCFGRTFEANQEVLTVSAADALLPGSPQAGGYTRATRDGSGRVVKRVVSGGTAQSDAVEYAYDRLGRMARMYREDTSVLPPRAAVTVWHHDSLGQLVELDEQGNAPQFHSYDSAGNVTRVSWCDSTVSACAPGVRNRAVIRRYDGRGRLVHAEDQSGGVTVPGTPRDFTYDRAIATAAPAVSPTFVIGRLTQATAATSAVTLGYDGYGRVNTSVFTDLTTSANNVYVEKHEYHADGAPLATHLQLPDHAFQDERVDYAYDSAARMTGVSYTDGTTRSLFGATAGASIYDELGRVRAARFGATPYTATYNATGRQTLRELTAGVAGTADYRDVLFAPTPGTAGAIDPFDPVGRERVRQETIGSTVTTKTASYDGLGQLVSTSVRAGASWAPTRSFAYDGLGNLLSQTSGAAGDGTSTALSYQPALTGDLDRLCAVAYGGASPGACNVTHDDVGNVLTYPDAEGTQRTLTYFPGGQVHTIARGAVSATFDYDAFGGVQRLVVNSPNATEVRHDKHFGSFVEVRDESGAPVVVRTVAGPGGMLAKRHGASAASPWTFTFGEARGARFVTDQTGKVVQDVDYAAFGQASSTGASVGSQTYENHQWNDGDALTALGLSQLGARIYDPALGRFLSRDPLLDTGSARAANPYTFALNDPINFTDPTGLEANSIPTISISRMIAEVVVASGGGSSTGDNTDLLPMLACLNGVGVCPDGYGGDDGSGSGDGSSGGGSGGAVVHVTLGGNPGARGLSSGRDPWGPSHVPGAEALQGKRWLDRQVARALNAIREPIVAAAEDAGSVVASALGSTEAGIENYATNGYANASPYWAKQELEPGLRKIGAISGEIVFQVGLVVATEGFGWLRTIAGGGGGVVGGARQTLYHYTSEAGRSAILESGEILASQGAKNARHGVGQYFTDIAPEAIGGRIASATPPGKISLGQLSVRLFGVPWNTRKLASFLEIDVTGLGARLVAPNIWLRTGESSLEIVGRVCRSGSTLP